MRTIFSLILCAFLIVPQLSFADAIGLSESFDTVSVPTLPAGWTSSSLQGTQVAVTSNFTAHSAPNAAFVPAPGSTSSTALNTPTYNFSTGLATYALTLNFRHQRGFEQNFDGGVLEVSINGGSFVDVLSPSVGGVFSAGGYNSAPGGITGGPLVGRPGWTGTNASFESVSLKLPAVPDNASVKFRFLVGTDFIVAGSGWFIDSVVLTPEINIASLTTPLLTEVAPGGTIPVDVALLNGSSLNASLGTVFLSSPSSLLKSVMLSKSGFVQRFGKWLVFLSLVDQTASLSSDVFPTVIQDIPGQAAAKLTIINGADPAFSGASAAVSFLSSSPTINGGSLSGDIIFGSVDPCAPPPPVLPAPETGRIVVYPAPPTCSVGQAALTYQARGAIAFIVAAPPPIVPPVPGEFPSPFTTEAATPGLTIPTFTSDLVVFTSLLSGVGGAPGMSTASLQGFNSAELRTIAVSAISQTGGDPKRGDNYSTALVNVVTDVDGDGTPDYRDACKADAAKIAPGSCGCGIADVDANGNGVLDCFTALDAQATQTILTANFKSDVAKLQSLLKKFSLKSKQYKTQKTQLTNLRKTVASFGVSNAGIVRVSAAGVDISKLTKKADKAVANAIKAKTASSLATTKKAAAKELAKLLKGIA